MNTATHFKAPSRSPQAARGFSLIEAMVAAAISSIVTALALPGYVQMHERSLVRQAAAQFEADVMLARSLAAQGQQTWRLSFERTSTHSCYVLHTGAAGECGCAADGAAVCTGSAQVQRVARWGSDRPLTVRANVRSILFDGLRGTSTPTGTVRFEARSGASQSQIVNILGRVRSCSSSGLSGVPRC